MVHDAVHGEVLPVRRNRHGRIREFNRANERWQVKRPEVLAKGAWGLRYTAANVHIYRFATGEVFAEGDVSAVVLSSGAFDAYCAEVEVLERQVDYFGGQLRAAAEHASAVEQRIAAAVAAEREACAALVEKHRLTFIPDPEDLLNELKVSLDIGGPDAPTPIVDKVGETVRIMFEDAAAAIRARGAAEGK